MQNIMKTISLISATSLILVMSGCSTPAPLHYAPSSIKSANGNANVAMFNYVPAEIGDVKVNQIKNTAIGSIYFDKQIDRYYTDAVFAEARTVGIKMGDFNNIISGDINRFIIDDLGYSIDWTLDVNYIVRKKDTNTICFERRILVQKNTSKFMNIFGTLNEVIKLNIEEIFTDDSFLKCIE